MPANASGAASTMARAPAHPAGAQVASLQAAVERRLASLLPEPMDAQDRVAQAMREAVLSPGKRLRPLLMLTACQALQRDPSVLLDVACALEIVHAASLTLDDLPCMDDAQLRRGRPALHRAFGEDVALLAAVAQLSLAYRIVAATPALAPALRVQVALALADASGLHGLVKGQFRDLHANVSADADADEASAAAAETNRLKTGSLFGAAFDIAALAADCNAALRERLQHCAAHIGQAFQLLDDLHDGAGPTAGPGQAGAGEGSEGSEGGEDGAKCTLVTLLRGRAAKARLQHHVRAADALLQVLFPQDEALRGLLQQVFAAAPGITRQ